MNGDGQLVTGQSISGTNLFAYCDNNPVNRLDPSGNEWYHWLIGAVVVAACAVAVVATAGCAAAAIGAVGAVCMGTAATTTASTVAAAAFVASATVYGLAVVDAAVTSKSVKEFNSKGNWGTVAKTAGAAVVGGLSGYVSGRNSSPSNKGVSSYSPVNSRAPQSNSTNNLVFPGYDPNKCEILGFEWRGYGSPDSGQGNYYNMQTQEWLHPDLDHGPPIGPHWDYGVRGIKQVYRIFPDGQMLPK